MLYGVRKRQLSHAEATASALQIYPADANFMLGILGDRNMAKEERLEEMTDKTVLVFCAHPDDDSFYCAGTLAKLVKNNNNVIMVFYTNGNKGSHDLEMTSERLAQIRKREEEEACAVIGIEAENIIWLGYDDGELEYANAKELWP